MDIEQARDNMVKQQLRTWHVLDERVLALYRDVPREQFMPEDYRQLAFADLSIPIDHGQTTMPPKEEARMLQALDVQATDNVLQVGIGNGYVTALLAKLANWVYSIDNVEALTEQAAQRLQALNIDNVTLLTGDVIEGWQQQAPFDVIVITGSLSRLPEIFRRSLFVGGRLFVILGEAPVMRATLIKRVAEDRWLEEKLFETDRPRLSGVEQPARFVF